MSLPVRTRHRLRAATIHLGLSVLVAVGVATLTLAIWYPGAYSVFAGGRHLLWLLVSVDVIIGPLLTLVVFDTRKRRAELTRDLAVIAALQFAALGYGLNTVRIARPVALVFEGSRFRVVSANDVRIDELASAPQPYRRLPLTGPLLLGTRSSARGAESLEALDLALKGFDIGQRPSYWQPYAQSRDAALAESRPAELLAQRYPGRKVELQTLLAELRLAPQDARFVPTIARQDCVVILNPSGDVVGLAPFDGFF